MLPWNNSSRRGKGLWSSQAGFRSQGSTWPRLEDGTTIYYQYDPIHQLTGEHWVDSNNQTLYAFNYDYDSAGNRTKIIRDDADADFAYTCYYTYDSLHQLTGERQVSYPGGVEQYAFSWEYDPVGNRTKQVRDGVVTYYYCNSANQLIRSEENGSLTYWAYDKNGNTISEQGPQGTTYYRYTEENMLDRITSTIAGSIPNYFYYDGDNKRMRKEDSYGTTRFIYDEEKIAVEKDAGGSTLAVYANEGPSIYSPLLSMRRDTTTYSYLFDALGTTLNLRDPNQNSASSYRWEAWGRRLAGTGILPNAFQYVGRFGYYTHSDSGFLLLKARYYWPTVGRFLTVDPLTLDRRSVRAGRYAYAANTPTAFVDPTGRYVYPHPPILLTCEDRYDRCLIQAAAAHIQCIADAQRTVACVKRWCYAACEKLYQFHQNWASYLTCTRGCDIAARQLGGTLEAACDLAYGLEVARCEAAYLWCRLHAWLP